MRPRYHAAVEPTCALAQDEVVFSFNAVTPGAYEVRVSLEGFKTVTIRLDIGVNQTLRADAGEHPDARRRVAAGVGEVLALPAPERQGDTLVFPVLPLPFVIADRREVGLAVR
jgi:hypothetical protein